MKALPRIAESEWQVMRVLWRTSPLSANEVVDEVAPATKWKPKTVKTLLNRLVAKKALGFRKEGRAYLYYPLVNEADCVKADSRSFAERVYGGALAPVLANLIEESDLSKDEIAELRRILDRKGG
jgi:BlaI family transcriptional regulator, penicillinase repressor